MYRKLLILPLLSAAFLLASCSSSGFFDLNDLKSELNLAEFPSQSDYPDAEAVVLTESHDVNVRINSDWELETEETVHKAVKLLKNVEGNSSVQIHIHSGERLDNISARTVKADGTVIELSEKDIFKIKGEGENSVFYSDVEKLRFTFPGVEPNCIIEYRYKVFKPQPFIYDVWGLQDFNPTLRNQYKLTVPNLLIASEASGGAGWNWNYRVYNYDLKAPEFTKNMNPEAMRKSANVSFIWEVKDVPGFKPDPSMPAYENYLSYVKFAPSDWKSWNDITEWYYNRYLKPCYIPTPAVQEKAEKLTSGLSDEMSKISKVFNYVQKMRYVAIALGDGGIRPHTPQSVMEKEYGDCKDKSTLLIALLKSLGIKASPVLVLVSSDGLLDEGFPSWNFNHMIVKAETKGGKAVWMDPTISYCKPGALSSECQGIKVLVMNHEGKARVEVTPATTFVDNKTDIKIKVDVNDKREALYNIQVAFKGEEDMALRSYLKDMSRDDMAKFCKNLITDDYVNTKIENYSLSDLDSVYTDLTLKFSFTVQNALQEQGDLYMLTVDPYKLFRNIGFLSKEERIYPLEFDVPYTMTKTIDITLPENMYSVRNLPQSRSFSERDLNFMINYKNDTPNHINATETFQLRSRWILPSNYTNVRAFFDDVKKKMNEKIILTTKAA